MLEIHDLTFWTIIILGGGRDGVCIGVGTSGGVCIAVVGVLGLSGLVCWGWVAYWLVDWGWVEYCPVDWSWFWEFTFVDNPVGLLFEVASLWWLTYDTASSWCVWYPLALKSTNRKRMVVKKATTLFIFHSISIFKQAFSTRLKFEILFWEFLRMRSSWPNISQNA